MAAVSISTVGRSFCIDGEFVAAAHIQSGHINESYVACYSHENTYRRYVHQKINDKIFQDIPALMQNIGRVTRHIQAKLTDRGAGDLHRRALTLIPAREASEWGIDVFRDPEGGWWRTYEFVELTRTYDIVSSPGLAYEAARAFGEFIADLADLPGQPLHETIVGFHSTPQRYQQLLDAVSLDPCGRVREAQDEIRFCRENEETASLLLRLIQNETARLGVTHNDTKFNNVLIDDASGEAICVIDLDTVMPGLALYDFGDLVRTGTVSAAEDERDLRLVDVDERMFGAVAQGFVAGARGRLSGDEISNLVTAGVVMTFECGMRFLADYLLGDRYFRISREGQNLDRARAQFALARSLQRKESRLKALLPR